MTALTRIALFFSVALWAWFLVPEARYDGFNGNDLYAHESLTRLVVESWRAGNAGLDAWHDGCCLGSAPFRGYQHLPHFLAALVHRATDWPLSRVLHVLIVVALCLQGPAAYGAVRLGGLGRAHALGAAWLVATVSSSLRLGHGWESYLFFGDGLFTQALGLPFFLLALGLGVRCASGEFPATRRRDAAWLAALTALAFGFHHLFGYLAILTLAVLALVALVGRWLRPRAALEIVVIAAGGFVVMTAYQLLSLVQDGGVFRRGELDPAFRWDGHGFTLVRWLFGRGDLLDFERVPVLTVLSLGGLVTAFLPRAPRATRLWAACFATAVMLLSGRPTFGAALDFLPGFTSFPLERALVLLHVSAAILAAGGAIGATRALGSSRPAAVVVVIAVLYPIVERARALVLNAQGIARQEIENRAFDPSLLAGLPDDGSLAIFPGATGKTWVGNVGLEGIVVGLGQPQISKAFYNSTHGSEAVYGFRYDDPAHYRYFNVTALLATAGAKVPDFLTKVATRGDFSIYRAPGEGPFGVGHITRVAIVEGPYQKALDREFFGPSLREGAFTSLVPAAVARRFPASVPRAAPAAEGGTVAEAATLGPGHYAARLTAPRDGAHGILRTGYHPRWEIRVDGRRVEPKWVTPGFVAFPIPGGTHDVEAVFPEDPVRRSLFLLSGLALAALAAAFGAKMAREQLLSRVLTVKRRPAAAVAD